MNDNTFLTLDQYRVSALATVHHRKTFQHFRLKAVIVHGHKHKYLGVFGKHVNLTKQLLYVPRLEPLTSQPWAVGQIYSTRGEFPAIDWSSSPS